MPEPIPTAEPPEADTFLLGRTNPRLPDGGPIYKETPRDPSALAPGQIAEPWNTVTAFLFVLIVLFWVIRLWGRFRQHPFVTVCLPVLLAGGIGGTLYHMHRSRFAYFILDVIPISLLGLGGAAYLAVRLGKNSSWQRVVFVMTLAVLAYLFVNAVLLRGMLGTFGGNPQLIVNLSYASLAIVLLVPLFLVLLRTRFRHYGLVLASLASFAIAWFMRLVDNTFYGDLPMGTHWLWHTFGALTTLLIMEYFRRIEVETIA